MHLRRALFTIAALASPCGCGTSAHVAPDASIDGATTDGPAASIDAGLDVQPSEASCLGAFGCDLPDVFAPVVCPASPPAVGSPCPVVTEVCEYGGSWSLGCNVSVECTPGGWQKVAAGPCPAVDAAGACPVTWAEAQGLDASAGCPAIDCQYPEGACECLQCSAGQHHVESAFGQWSCKPATAACPTPRPDLGTACSTPEAGCDYAPSCCTGEHLQCMGGVWVGYTSGPCP